MSTNAQKFGLLSLMNVELPPESEAAKADMDEMNAKLKGLGFRTYRLAYDWGYQTYADIFARAKQRKHHEEIKQPFKSGDLVKVFKTVSEGDVAWEGTVSLNHKRYHHGIQKGMRTEKWVSMFYNQLPARLERDGDVKFGALEPFSETGTEGVIWSFCEYGKNGYDALVCLKDGDKLTVYKNVREGEVEWEGAIDVGPVDVKKLKWHEVVRDTNHMDTQIWLELSFQRRPVVVTPS